MIVTHNLGFPRIGAQRELKQALETYWRGDSTRVELEQVGQVLRARHWRQQADAGLDLIPVGDFSWYDHVLDLSTLLGVVPERFEHGSQDVDLDTYFRMARGRAPSGEDAPACEMTKWFDTNYHYIVPEFSAQQIFRIASHTLFSHIDEARALGHAVKPVLLGPLTYLWLGKTRPGNFDKLTLLDRLLPAYGEILQRLKQQGVQWVQIDEPILALELPLDWRRAFESAYTRLQVPGLKRLVATYFGALHENTQLACRLPVDGLHIDLARAPQQLHHVLDHLPPYKVLSLGIVDGRNIWRTDLNRVLEVLEPIHQRLGERLWLAPSCALLHVPVDLAAEDNLDHEVKSWLAFAVQKLDEIALLKRALMQGRAAVSAELADNHTALVARRRSPRIHRDDVRTRMQHITDTMTRRAHPYAQRTLLQQHALHLPLFPTTTIGSFPQTPEIRAARREFKDGKISVEHYTQRMRAEIATTIRAQEALGLDVLVHGEAERNDMVEYFGEQLDGFVFTRNGWVQSYGSRCVKPPIIYGDVRRPQPMTLEWSVYAQTLATKPVKGMLTGPVTMLQWSFVRDDQTRAATCMQIALALRDEVTDLEHAGIRIIQIDEPAFREGLPLRRDEQRAYLDWAARCFRVSASAVGDATQIHTHMCYAEFNDIIAAIAALDADVITIETSRSALELLDAFVTFRYPNEIGPGVYDIHSPRIPSVEDMVVLLEVSAQRIPPERLWVNPDCGLKTRGWPETQTALRNMVEAAKLMRQRAAYVATVTGSV